MIVSILRSPLPITGPLCGSTYSSASAPEFAAKAVRQWLRRVGVKTLFIEPGSPWENGYVESSNGKLRDELLNGDIFEMRGEATLKLGAVVQ